MHCRNIVTMDIPKKTLQEQRKNNIVAVATVLPQMKTPYNASYGVEQYTDGKEKLFNIHPSGILTLE